MNFLTHKNGIQNRSYKETLYGKSNIAKQNFLTNASTIGNSPTYDVLNSNTWVFKVLLCNTSNAKLSFAFNQKKSIGLVEHNKEKSTKFVNFLQFLVYKELSTSEKKEKTKGTNSFKKIKKRLYTNENLSFNMNFKKSLTQKKADLNSFFPYSKTWICYWLLPFMGFISYLSSNISKNNYGFLVTNPSVTEPQIQLYYSTKDYTFGKKQNFYYPFWNSGTPNQKMDKNANNLPVVFNVLQSNTSNKKQSSLLKEYIVGQPKNDSNNWTLIGSSSIVKLRSNTSEMFNSPTFIEFYNLWYPNFLEQKKNFGLCSNISFHSTFDFNQKSEDPLFVNFSKNLSHNISKNSGLTNTKYLTSFELSKTFVPINSGATNLFVLQKAAINNTIYPDKFYTVPTGKIILFNNKKRNSLQSVEFSKNTKLQSISSLIDNFIPLSKKSIVKSNTNMRKVNSFFTAKSAYGVSLLENRIVAFSKFAKQQKVLLGISTKSNKTNTLFGEPFSWNNLNKKLSEKSKNKKTTTLHNSFYTSLSNLNEKQHLEDIFYVFRGPYIAFSKANSLQGTKSNTFNKKQSFLLKQNPLLSYKKASLLMDEFLKEMKQFKEMKTLVTTNTSKSSPLDSLLLPVLKKENFQIYFPKYFNKILKKNTLLNAVQNKKIFQSFHNKGSFPYNVSMGHGPFSFLSKMENGLKNPKEVLSRQYFYQKTAFLEKMIFSLSKEKNQKWVYQKIGNKSTKNTSFLKQLSKEQLYSIVLNSFTKSLDSFFNENAAFLKKIEKSENNMLALKSIHNPEPNLEHNLEQKDSKFSKATLLLHSYSLEPCKLLAELKAIQGPTKAIQGPTPKKSHSVFQLNHPLMFANVEQKSSSFNTNQPNNLNPINQNFRNNNSNVHFWLGGTQKQKETINSNPIPISSYLNKGVPEFNQNLRNGSWFNLQSQKSKPVVSGLVVKPQKEMSTNEYFSKYINFLYKKLNNFCAFSSFTKQTVQKATNQKSYQKNVFVSATNINTMLKSNTSNSKQSFLEPCKLLAKLKAIQGPTLKNNTKENKIEKIFRSYLSKKRKPFQSYIGLEKNNISFKNEFLKNNSSLKNISNNNYNNRIILPFSILSKAKTDKVNKKNTLFGIDPQLKEKTRYTLGNILLLHKGSIQNNKKSWTFLELKNWVSPERKLKLINQNQKLLELSKLSKKELNELKEMKQTTITSLFKNRAFLVKSTSKENENQNISNNGIVKEQNNEKISLSNNGSYYEKLEKRKYAQKKHRRKKQRKETRRRKKRKRFYPRPSWIRSKLYNNYLKQSVGSKLEFQECLGSLKTFQVSRKNISMNSNVVDNSLENRVSILSPDKPNKIYGKDKALYSHSIYVPNKKVNRTVSYYSNGCLENLPLYSTKDFYQIKTSVLGELKRSFWKSYWLRSNLQPYLTHIKEDFKELKESSTKTTHSLNYKNFISFFSGLQFKSNYFPQLLTSDSWKVLLKTVEKGPSKFEVLESPNYESSYISNISLANKPSISWPSINSTLYGKPNNNEKVKVQGFLGYDEKIDNYNPNKWQLITQIYEHNRIMYERIQNLILNIRENVNLSGQIKPRPYKRMGHQKLKSFFSLKQNNPNNPNNNDFWIKLGKNKVLRSLFQSSYKYYGDFSKYRLYWAIHKSNLGSFKTTNKVKSIWMSTKNRDQRKANKTKKILYDLSMKYNSFLNYSTILSKKFKLGETNNLIWKRNSATNLNFVKNKLDIPLPLNVYNSIEKTLEIGERKLKQKQQKLRIGVGTTVNNQVLVRIPNTKKGGNNHTLKDFNNFGKVNKPMIPGYVQKFTNEINYWWNESKIKKIHSFQSVDFFNSINMEFPVLLEPCNLLAKLKGIQGPTTKTDSLVSKTNVPLWVSTFLFHFCAFISLISISQIRDFIKFTLIMTSKISKVYFNLIYLSLNSFFLFKKIKKTKNSQLGIDFSAKQALHRGVAKQHLETSSSTSFLSYDSILGFSNNTKTFFNLLESPTVKEKTIFLGGVNNNKGSNTTMILETKKAYFSNTFYYMFVSFLKKPFLLFQPFAVGPCIAFSFAKSLQGSSQEQSLTKLKENNQKTTLSDAVQSLELHKKEDLLSSWNGGLSSTKTITKYQMTKVISKVILYSSMTSLVFSLKNISFLTYSYFVKSLNFIETFIRSVYTFFEKPGELIIDWMAYLFLVEWSSDFTNTIPDTVDTSISNSIQKFSRSLRFSLVFSYLSNSSSLSLNPLAVSTLNLQVSNLSVSLLGGSLIQRRILSMYEIFVNIACRPDTDLSVRQQKGKVFWDLWSDLFIQVAEDSNINVSELSNLKEEQNRLLEKLVITFNEPLLEGTLFNKKTSFSSENKKNPYTTRSLTQQRFSFFTNSLKSYNSKKKNVGLLPLSLSFKGNNWIQFGNPPIWKHWSTNQFLSYQGKDTELFIDLHPPKSLTHLTSLKYSQSIQQPIGLILCQIFSGIFYKQIAKNLLVVGPSGSEKSLLIQAIAGETEFKIITDNAYRYAMVFRGVAVGIKLLRDVFEALTLHTPCIFLLEDIHAIGERRPFLISDDENTKGTESSFSTERDEVHEKNQVVYQLTKHIISHYKKPYKGDFSLLIPTNHFCFDLFNSVAPNEKRSRVNLTPLSPISLVDKSTSDMALNKMEQNNPNSTTGKTSLWDSNKGVSNFQKTKLSSSLQLKKNQLLAPPATSPFSVLVLKEEKKLKPKKIVKEFPWAGLPGEQFLNVSKATYSIRVKVALLADMVLSNLSVKLDMITDLLVIIDSVKGNRGFVVFATTHVPYILDPALRRPGRFDETLSLPQTSSILSRWEILKSNLSLWHNPTFLGNRSTSLFTNPSLLNYGEPLSVFPLGVSVSLWQSHILKDFMLEKGGFVLNHQNKRFNIANSLLSEKLKVLKKSTAFFAENKSLDSLQTFRLFKETLSVKKNHNTKSKLNRNVAEQQFSAKRNSALHKTPSLTPTINKNNNANQSFAMYSGKRSTLKVLKKEIVGRSHTIKLQKVYNIVSKVLLSLQYCLNLPNQNIFNGNKTWGDFSFSIGTANSMTGEFSTNSTFGLTIHRVISLDSLVYMSLYSSPHIFKQHLTILMAGQIGQTFFQNSNLTKTTNKNGIEPCFNQTWKTATSLVFSFIQKRWIYQKNLILPKFLDFGPEGYKTEIPSPPSSNILLPAKRYENMKRTFTFSQLKQKTQLSISEKIQLHQQQRLVKRLYKIPLKEYFKSEILNTFTNNSIQDSLNLSILSRNQQTIENKSNTNNLTSFSNASIILAPLENKLSKTTSMNWYFRNRILNRHHTYLSNQWWNGQLQEHNTESTFLSDIDWRYSYFMTQSKDGSMGDLFIDFPDAEQYYNPKNQRWINTSGSWNSWFDFDKAVYEQYASHYISECFSNAYQFLDQNRELLDFYVITVFEKGMEPSKDLDELTILEIFKRFSGLS